MNKALLNFFSRLNQSNIPYFLLTDFEGDLTSHDVDLYVHSNSQKKFETLLFDFGWYKRNEPAYHLNHHFYFSIECNIILDVKFKLSFACGAKQCYTYNYAEELWARSFLNNKGIRRPSFYDSVMLYAAHLAYLERRTLNAKHKIYLDTYLTEFEQNQSQIPIVEINEIKKWIKNSYQDTELLKRILNPHFTQAHQRMVRQNHKINIGWGTKVLFLGTDGVGKSSLIKAVKEKMLIKTKQLYLGTGEEGWKLKAMKKMVRWKCPIKMFNSVLSFFKIFILLPVEFAARIVPVISKAKYSVVLIDRIPGQYLIDKNRSTQILYKMILPKPDLVFFLHAQPEVLQKRKPTEFSLKRFEVDNDKFRKVAEKVSDGLYISIDTSNLNIDQASDLILSEIYRNKKIYENILTGKAS